MATETTTIRVKRETRDQLARQARSRGLSLSALLSQVAQREERDELFRAEREAIISDRNDPEAVEEADLWSATLPDGID